MRHPPDGLIFDIQHYAIHDGPGIRTTAFLKGCPLQCQWCANPESQKPSPEISYLENECIRCGTCAAVCPAHAVRVTQSVHAIDRTSCDLCGQCVEHCPSGALEILGRYVSAPDLLKEMITDQPFWERSGGGITLSGGEPLAQPDFVKSFLELCRESHIHTAIETCLHAPPAIIRNVLFQADEIICDVKILDEIRHKALTGVSNRIISDNLSTVLASGKPVLVRMPLIPGINNTTENLRATGAFLSAARPGLRMELLPYHRMGASKYDRLGKTYDMKQSMPPTKEEMNHAAKELGPFNIELVKT